MRFAFPSCDDGSPGHQPGAFLCPFITIRPDGNGNTAGPPTPVHRPLWKYLATTRRSAPVHPFSGKNQATPIQGRKANPCLFPEKPIPEKWVASMYIYARACAHIRVRAHDIYVYGCNPLIFNNIRRFVIYSHLVKIY